MAKLADAPDLGSGAFGVGVRVPSPAPLENRSSNRCSFFIGINMLNIEDVKNKQKRKNQILFDRNSTCLQSLLEEIRKYPHKTLTLWALTCAQVPANELNKLLTNDDRVKIALDLCTKWMQGHVKMPQAKKALLSVHAIAKETDDAYIKALAHAIGQACGSVHVETHAFGLVMYEMTSIVIKYGIDDCIPYLEEKLEYYQRMLVECDYRIKYEELEWASFLKVDHPKNKEQLLFEKTKKN